MATYTMFWPQWMCDRAREQGLEGKPLRLLWGGHNQDTRFSRFKVGPGDTVVPIASVDGVLHALASLHVVEKTSADAWLAKNPGDERLRLHGCGSELLVGDGEGAPLRFDRAFTGAQLAKWRYDGTDGERPLKFLEKGLLKKTMSLQGVYRVTPATAKLVASVLAVEAREPEQTTGADLEASLRAAPADEKLARVLADAWLEAGDARGEVLAIELALAHETNDARAAELDARHAALMRKGAGMKKQPGGFPFRAMQGGRPFAELRATKLTLAGKDQEAVLRAFAAIAARFLDTGGFSAVELIRPPGLREPPPALSKRFDALGAERTAFVTWTRKKPLSVDETLQATGDDPAFIVTASGPLRAADGGGVLPFQAASQWLGSALINHAVLRLADRTMTMRLSVPLGCPRASARVAELVAAVKALGGSAGVTQLTRTASGDRALK